MKTPFVSPSSLLENLLSFMAVDKYIEHETFLHKEALAKGKTLEESIAAVELELTKLLEWKRNTTTKDQDKVLNVLLQAAKKDK